MNIRLDLTSAEFHTLLYALDVARHEQVSNLDTFSRIQTDNPEDIEARSILMGQVFSSLQTIHSVRKKINDA